MRTPLPLPEMVRTLNDPRAAFRYEVTVSDQPDTTYSGDDGAGDGFDLIMFDDQALLIVLDADNENTNDFDTLFGTIPDEFKDGLSRAEFSRVTGEDDQDEFFASETWVWEGHSWRSVYHGGDQSQMKFLYDLN